MGLLNVRQLPLSQKAREPILRVRYVTLQWPARRRALVIYNFFNWRKDLSEGRKFPPAGRQRDDGIPSRCAVRL